MAEQLEEFDFSRKQRTKYPWDEWLNGKPWRCVKGEDFRCEVKNFADIARVAARRNGLELTAKRVGQAVVIQAYSPNGASSA